MHPPETTSEPLQGAQPGHCLTCVARVSLPPGWTSNRSPAGAPDAHLAPGRDVVHPSRIGVDAHHRHPGGVVAHPVLVHRVPRGRRRLLGGRGVLAPVLAGAAGAGRGRRHRSGRGRSGGGAGRLRLRRPRPRRRGHRGAQGGRRQGSRGARSPSPTARPGPGRRPERRPPAGRRRGAAPDPGAARRSAPPAGRRPASASGAAPGAALVREDLRTLVLVLGDEAPDEGLVHLRPGRPACPRR